MILFCEECGTRHTIDDQKAASDNYRFCCHVCHEMLIVSSGGKQQRKIAQPVMAQAAMDPEDPVGKQLAILVVDDSKLIRKVLRQIIESDGRKRVVGEAEDGEQALKMLNTVHPDVITLDIRMPVMDGLTTLKHIMIRHPVPTVMISALTQEGATETFDSLKYGAIDFVPKPSRTKNADLQSQQDEILKKIELAAEVQLESVRYLRRSSQNKSECEEGATALRHLVVMGVAEGGYGALLNVIPRLKHNATAGYVAVMHQAPHHIDGFARYLDQCSQLNVRRVGDGVPIRPGRCYLAAAVEQVDFYREADQIILAVGSGPFNGPQGGIDRVLRAAAQVMQERVAGVILTGAGDDGLDGLGEIIAHGGAVFVQDPGSCLFKETPLKAMDRYHVDNLFSDKQMAGAINTFLMTCND